MAPGRIRRLVTQLLRWVWAPLVSFVLVVAVAMGCAVWSPVQTDLTSFGYGWTAESELPTGLRHYKADFTSGYQGSSFGLSVYLVTMRDSAWNIGSGRSTFVSRTGFPLRCMRWTTEPFSKLNQTSSWKRGIATQTELSVYSLNRRIPLMPEPVGMVLNVLIYSAVIVLPRFAWGRVVVIRRRRKSLCLKCAYPLGNFAICPECGAER